MRYAWAAPRRRRACAARRGVVLALLVVAPALADPLPPLLAAGAETVVATTPVPSPARRVGEVRLLRRDRVAVVQTVLDTALLPRVIAEIRTKEEANWPPGRPGHDDAVRYVTALEETGAALRRRQPKDPRRAHRRLHLLIEFALSDRQAAVAVSGWERDDAGGLRRVEPLVALPLSRDYVRANMRLIAADSFHVEGAALDALLAPLPEL